MARIQVLPLPTEKVGAIERTPYVLIFDGLDDERTGTGDPVFTAEIMELLTAKLPATSVWAVGGTLDVGNVDAELHAAAQAAVLREFDPERMSPEVRTSLEAG